MTAFFESQLKDLKGGKCSVNMNFILLKISYRKLEPAVSPPTFRHKWNKGSSQALCVTHCSSGLQLWNLTPRRLSVRPQPKTSHLCTGRMDGWIPLSAVHHPRAVALWHCLKLLRSLRNSSTAFLWFQKTRWQRKRHLCCSHRCDAVRADDPHKVLLKEPSMWCGHIRGDFWPVLHIFNTAG